MKSLVVKVGVLAMVWTTAWSVSGQAPLLLDSSCTVTTGNQTAVVGPDGKFLVENISVFESRVTGVAPQLYRVRATCLRDGQMLTGQSEFFSLDAGETTFISSVLPSELDPIPMGISASAPAESVPLGESVQVSVTATLADGTTEDVTLRAAGTTYLSTNPKLLQVDENGRVTGVNTTTTAQTATIAILNEGNLATISFQAETTNDFDGDGLPNDFETLFGLDPFLDDTDGDLDGDGLTNYEEFELGTLPNNPDTDLDGVPDGLDGDPLHPEESAPQVAFLIPPEGAALVEGETIRLQADARDDGLLTGVEFLVNGANLGGASVPPFELLFTVPFAADGLTFEARARDGAGHVASASRTALVSPDPSTDVAGTVLDPAGAPFEGADVELMTHGLRVDLFDFDQPLGTFPDLAGLLPDAVRWVSAVNLRNPNNLLSGDTFGVGFAPDYAARFSGLLRVQTSGTYTFTLGADDGARLTLDGTLVVEVVGDGDFTEATGAIDLELGVVPLQIEYFQSVGDAEVQLSAAGPDGVLSIIPPADLLQSPEPFVGSTGPLGEFSFVDVPTSLGDVQAAATATVNDLPARGTSLPVPPVRAGLTELGEIRLIPSFAGGNGGFETGDFTGYLTSGATAVIESLGPLHPPEGRFMAFLSSGLGAVNNRFSTISTESFQVPAGANRLALDFNFLTDEIPGNPSFQDELTVRLTAPDGSILVSQVIASVQSADDFVPADGTGFFAMTGFRSVQVDVSALAGTGTLCSVTFSIRVSDVGDTLFESAGLIDDLRFE